MDQDGKLDETTKELPANLATSRIMLTLCTPSDGSCYRHATIPFPPSYKAACEEAMKIFAGYLPPFTQSVYLYQAAQRKYGQAVWSMIPLDSWDTILNRGDEEIGVFLTNIISPEKIGYEYRMPSESPPKRLVSLQFCTEDRDLNRRFKLLRSYTDCLDYLRDVVVKRGVWRGYEVKYDQRMIGSPAEQRAYKEQTCDSEAVWCEIDDPELFDFLLCAHPEPMRVRIRVFSPTVVHGWSE
ncbi:hypothetical protein D9619_002281 [Psilocybe cf. subviscida]|uniref:Uncharacterized protein n=1 Tax=Psilocybe cf. subviscida TaxID=2480587 RepID=A0A8H5F377_9AGAR|nr:hypothetical protein D9619_002281 [Psilocybe cf. subviscida]